MNTSCTPGEPRVGVYIDDLLIAGPVVNNIDRFKQEMWEQF
jgi:hypothetical protein